MPRLLGHLNFVPPFDLALEYKELKKEIPTHGVSGLCVQPEEVASCRGYADRTLTYFKDLLSADNTNPKGVMQI